MTFNSINVVVANLKDFSSRPRLDVDAHANCWRHFLKRLLTWSFLRRYFHSSTTENRTPFRPVCQSPFSKKVGRVQVSIEDNSWKLWRSNWQSQGWRTFCFRLRLSRKLFLKAQICRGLYAQSLLRLLSSLNYLMILVIKCTKSVAARWRRGLAVIIESFLRINKN